MTEITDTKINSRAIYSPKIVSGLLIGKPRKPGYLIDPVAFFIALIAGPVLVTVATFWLLLIPVFALFMGGPIYLVVGTPLLLIYLRRNQASVHGIAYLAFMATLVLAVVAIAVSIVTGLSNQSVGAPIFLSFALIFAPIWGAAFGAIYLKLRRDFYAVARPV